MISTLFLILLSYSCERESGGAKPLRGRDGPSPGDHHDTQDEDFGPILWKRPFMKGMMIYLELNEDGLFE